jgi:hypothetical protein
MDQVAINQGMKLKLSGYIEDTPITEDLTILGACMKEVSATCTYTLTVGDSLGITSAFLSTSSNSQASSGASTLAVPLTTKVYIYFTLTHDMHKTHLGAYTLVSGTAGKAGARYRSTTGHTSSTTTKTLTLSLG